MTDIAKAYRVDVDTDQESVGFSVLAFSELDAVLRMTTMVLPLADRLAGTVQRVRVSEESAWRADADT